MSRAIAEDSSCYLVGAGLQRHNGFHISENKMETIDSTVISTPAQTTHRTPVFRIHMFLSLPDPDPLVKDIDPDPSIIKQK
jgi:hypothetical protein